MRRLQALPLLPMLWAVCTTKSSKGCIAPTLLRLSLRHIIHLWKRTMDNIGERNEPASRVATWLPPKLTNQFVGWTLLLLLKRPGRLRLSRGALRCLLRWMNGLGS